MKKISVWLVGVLLAWVFSSVYALEAPKDLRAKSASDTSISLDWSDVEGSVWYYLYYGEKTASGWSYEVEGVNLIEESEYVLKELKPATKYYLAVTSVDTLSTESSFSNELEYMTLAEGSKDTVSSLRIEGVEVIDATSIEMYFSKEIAASTPREFLLQEKETNTEISISVSEVRDSDSRKIVAVLESDLQENTQYKLTVLDIQDTDGGNISSGIDAFTNFTTSIFQKEELPDLNAAENSEKITLDDVPSPQTESMQKDDTIPSVSPKDIALGNGGKTVSQASLNNNTIHAASDTDKLPKTGAEHWLLVFFAFLLSAGIYYKTRK